MAGPGPHPVSYIKPARPLYRFAATGLGASMWFFVSIDITPNIAGKRADRGEQLMYRAKKDGPALLGWSHPWEHGEH